MRFRRAPLLKSAACFAVLALLLGVGAASAVERDERVAKQTENQVHFKSIGAGKYQGLPSFLKLLAGSRCTSGCCWATANCAGGNTQCSESRCDAWCPDGSHSAYICSASADSASPGR